MLLRLRFRPNGFTADRCAAACVMEAPHTGKEGDYVRPEGRWVNLEKWKSLQASLRSLVSSLASGIVAVLRSWPFLLMHRFVEVTDVANLHPSLS